MKWKAVIKGLNELAAEDGDLNEEANISDILDYLGILGVEGGSASYFKSLNLPRKTHAAEYKK